MMGSAIEFALTKLKSKDKKKRMLEELKLIEMVNHGQLRFRESL
jgi:hypothetical protein